MPVLAYQSKIRAVADHGSLTLTVRHRIQAGKTSETVIKSRLPNTVDILLASNLVITISGIYNGAQVPTEDIRSSSLAEHLVEYLQMVLPKVIQNASDLGIGSVSNVFPDEEDGTPKLILTSSRHSPLKTHTPPSTYVFLIGLDLCYSWQTTAYSQSLTSAVHSTSNPFAKRLSLPFRTVLDNVVGRFVTWQLVKRYPLIFGPWCQQLHNEASYFPVISSSVLSIMQRSSDTTFRSKCKRLLKNLNRRQDKAFAHSSTLLTEYISPKMRVTSKNHSTKLSHEATLSLALERVYCSGLSQLQFKCHTHNSEDHGDDEVLSQEHISWAGGRPSELEGGVVPDNTLKNPLAPAYYEPFFVFDVPSMIPPVPMHTDLKFPQDELLDDEDGNGHDCLRLEHWSDDEDYHLRCNYPQPVGDAFDDDECMATPVPLDLDEPQFDTATLSWNDDNDLFAVDSDGDFRIVSESPAVFLGAQESNALDEALHDLSAELRLQSTSHFDDESHYKEDPTHLTISDDRLGDGGTNDILSDTDSTCSTLLETSFEALSDLAHNVTWPLDDDTISDRRHLSGGKREPAAPNVDNENEDEGVILIDF